MPRQTETQSRKSATLRAARSPSVAGAVRSLFAVRAVRWFAGPAALVALLAWVLGQGRADAAVRPPSESSAPAAQDGAPAYAASTLGGAATQDLSKAARASATRAVERTAAERNAGSEKDRAAFASSGWTMVKTDPPDARLAALDPELLSGRETELRVQMASTVASPAQAPQLAEIVRRAREEQTRTLAVEALGRAGGPEAQRELYNLLTTAGLDDSDRARGAIAPLLRPADLHEPYAAQLAALLDSRVLTPVERKQIAFTLALVGLRDGTELAPAVQDSLSPEARQLIASMAALATRSSIPAASR
jgi:hypothetical protein